MFHEKRPKVYHEQFLDSLHKEAIVKCVFHEGSFIKRQTSDVSSDNEWYNE